MDDFEEIDTKEVIIRKLQNALWLISSVHCGDGNEDEETCVYCGTQWPCFTSRVARKSATHF